MRVAARRYHVAVTTVKRAVVHQRETGARARKPIPGCPRRIGKEQEAILLLARLEEAPDATGLQHGAWWTEHQGQQLSEATMWRALRRGGLDAPKQALAASERDETARAVWRQDIAQRAPQRFVFVEASGAPHTALTRLYGWAPHNRRATDRVPRQHGKHTTLVAALTPTGLQAPWAMEGAIDTAAFVRSVTDALGPTWQPGQLVMLDTLSVHTASHLHAAMTARGCQVLLVPAYSPDFTPIEHAFSTVNAVLRGRGARTREALLEAVGQAVAASTPG